MCVCVSVCVGFPSLSLASLLGSEGVRTVAWPQWGESLSCQSALLCWELPVSSAVVMVPWNVLLCTEAHRHRVGLRLSYIVKKDCQREC